MRTGTRRMWARRTLRAGYLIAPIFSFPKWFYHKFLTNYNDTKFSPLNAFFALFITTWFSVLFGFLGMTVYVARQASPETIREAAENPCVADMMKRWQAQLSTPLKIDHVLQSKKSCADAILIAEQQKAMSK